METKEIEITPDTLSGWLNKGKPVYIIDVRTKDQREEWAIPNSIHVDVYARLNANDTTVFDSINLPSNIPIVTVCGGGKMSLIAAEQLQQKGFEAFSLTGGMKAWNYAWNTADLNFAEKDLKIIQVRRSAKGCLSYIAGSATEAIVIDASLDPSVYIELAKKNDWTICYVMDTHIHADYISRTRELAETAKAKHLFIKQAQVNYPFTEVTHGDEFSFGNSSFEILHTPGHTWESTSYKIGHEVIFTGDTLFVDGVGRPDLKASKEEAIIKAKQLFNTLKQLLKLPSNSLVLPAHTSGAVPFDAKPIVATLGTIVKNVKMLSLSETEFIKYTLTRIPPTPPNYLTIAELNKKGNHVASDRAELEAGANRCAIA